MHTVSLARNAMATRFEFVLHGENEAALRAAGEEALDEIERLESRLSLFKPASEIANVNALAARQPVRVTPEVFALLVLAQRLGRETAGAFDITVAPLVHAWGFMGGKGHFPDASSLAAARACVGVDKVELDGKNYTVRFTRPGMMLDLGAIGKGYAIERSVEILREAGVTSAFIHGGTSTVYALGAAPEGKPWKVAVDNREAGGEEDVALATVELSNEAMSVSAVRGKSFQAGGKTFGHVLDPRTGEPATNAVLSAVVVPSATESDALSTALLILGPAGQDCIVDSRPGARTLVAFHEGAARKVETRGIRVNAPAGSGHAGNLS